MVVALLVTESQIQVAECGGAASLFSSFKAQKALV
jgi:hypothetical protein